MEETPVSAWSVSKWGARHDFTPLTGPPDQLQPRIDAFSFSCQECNRTILLPWGKISASIANDMLQIDCPHCHQQYPFDYDRAQRKTLSITFHGIIREEHQSSNEPAEYPIPEPSKPRPNFENTEAVEPELRPAPLTPEPETPALKTMPPPIATEPLNEHGTRGRLASLTEKPVGEAAKAIRTSSRALVGSLVNNRIVQTMASRLQPSNAGSFSEASSPAQFSHLLVPGGKEGESLSQVIPDIPNKWSATTETQDFGVTHRTFEDMTHAIKQADSLTQSSAPRLETAQSPPTPDTAQLGPPDRLEVQIENFLFNCQDCDSPIPLPWEKVEAGQPAPGFPIDCPSCHHQYPFNYEQAKRKTLTLRFTASLQQNLPETIPTPGPEPKPLEAPEPPEPPQSPIPHTRAIVAIPKNAIMALPKNAIVVLRKYSLVELPKKISQELRTIEQQKATGYSPGAAYDRAILERG